MDTLPKKICKICGTDTVPNPAKQWYSGPTCYKCYKKAYLQKNKVKVKKSVDAWRANNSERHKANEKRWRKDNFEHNKKTQDEWRKKNIDRGRKNQREYQKQRELNDITYKIKRRIRHRLYIALRNEQKIGSGIKDLGCSIQHLKTHLEQQFYDGMTWDNYGQWHIDHVEPLCSFDLTDEVQFKKACNYNNLQPLWTKDHFEKTANDNRNIRKR